MKARFVLSVVSLLTVPVAPWHNPPHAPVALNLGAARDAVRHGGSAWQYAFTVASNSARSAKQDGREIRLSGDTWKSVPFDHLFTPFTVLEFELKNSGQDATQGIGIGADGTIHRAAIFLAHASAKQPVKGKAPTVGSLWSPVQTDDDGWKHYRIPVGRYLRYLRDYGVKPCVLLINERGKDHPAECRFRKVRIAEEPAS